jgi:hypothetical protein
VVTDYLSIDGVEEQTSLECPGRAQSLADEQSGPPGQVASEGARGGAAVFCVGVKHLAHCTVAHRSSSRCGAEKERERKSNGVRVPSMHVAGFLFKCNNRAAVELN